MKNKPQKIQFVEAFVSHGDFVRCNSCSKTMVVPAGADKCPLCYREGTLRWEDETRQEAGTFDLAGSGQYKVRFLNEPHPSQYLSDEVLMQEFNAAPDFRFRNPENNRWEITRDGRTLCSGTRKEMEAKFAGMVKKKATGKRQKGLKLTELHCSCKK